MPATRSTSTTSRPPPSEKTIVERILKWLNDQPNTRARKVHGSGYSKGWADIVGCVEGKMFCFEVKKPVGSYGATAIQNAELDLWRQAGAIACVVTSLDQVQHIHEVLTYRVLGQLPANFPSGGEGSKMVNDYVRGYLRKQGVKDA